MFQAELVGVLEGAKVALDSLKGEDKVTFHIDSQSVIKALSRTVVKSRLVKETAEKLEELAKKTTVTLQWVKAHVGHQQNEEVDCLAKEATEMAPERQYPMPFSHIKALIKDMTLARWQSDWESLINHRQSRICYPDVDLARSRRLLNFSKEMYGKVIIFLTGFCGLKYCRLKLKEINESTCRLCDGPREEAQHILFECPALSWKRHHIFGYQSEISTDYKTWSVESLFKFSEPTPRSSIRIRQ